VVSSADAVELAESVDVGASVVDALEALGLRTVSSAGVQWVPARSDLETRHVNVDRLPSRITAPLATLVEHHDIRERVMTESAS
jgi:hypothetical protein